MHLNTKVENPLCKKLPSSIDRVTQSYDDTVLKRFYNARGVPYEKSSRSRSRSPSGNNSPASVWVVRRDGTRGCSVSPAPQELGPAQSSSVYKVTRVLDQDEERKWASQRVRESSSSPMQNMSSSPSVRHSKGRFSGRKMPPSEVQFDTPQSQAVQAASPEYRSQSYHSPGSVVPPPVLADAHRAFVAKVRESSVAANEATRKKVARTSQITAEELRRHRRAAETLKTQAQKTLQTIREESLVTQRVFGFLMEIRGVRTTGMKSVRKVIDARKGRRDTVSETLHKQEETVKKYCGELDTMLKASEGTVRDLRRVEAKLTAASEAISSSLEMDNLDLHNHDVDPDSGGEETDPAEVLREAETLLLKSVESRRKYKKDVTTMEDRCKKNEEKIMKAVKTRLAYEEAQLESGKARMAALQDEQTKTNTQLDLLKTSTDERIKERDIICKRLRLREQRPLLGENHDKVCAALNSEHNTLTTAIDTLTLKHNHLSLEASRLSDTCHAMKRDLAAQTEQFKIDKSILLQPLADLPKNLTGMICSGNSSVYGIGGLGGNY